MNCRGDVSIAIAALVIIGKSLFIFISSKNAK